MQCRRDAEVELGRVDPDEGVRTAFQHRAADPRAQGEQARQVMQDLEQPHHRQLLGMGESLATGGLHARTRDADEARAGRALADGRDQCGAQVVARGLAGDEADCQGMKGTRPFDVYLHVRWKSLSVKGGASPSFHQRMMLRSLAPRKSTKAASSGCDGTSAFNSAVASASLRPER